MDDSAPVWLITGTTSGVGLALAKAVAARGGRVIATGRNARERLADIQTPAIRPMDLDISKPLAEIRDRIAEAVAVFGRIDYVVNNAAWVMPSCIEEASEAFVEKTFQTNLFGAIKVTQAVLPHLRERGSGTLAYMGAGFSWAPVPFLTYYAAAKAALSAYVEGLQKEVAPFGLRATVLEIGGFKTGGSRVGSFDDEAVGGGYPQIPAYAAVFAETFGRFNSEVKPAIPNDLEKLPGTLIDILSGTGRAAGRPFPVRVAIGLDTIEVIRQKCREQLQLCDEWEDVSLSVVSDGAAREPAPYLMEACSILRLAD